MRFIGNQCKHWWFHFSTSITLCNQHLVHNDPWKETTCPLPVSNQDIKKTLDSGSSSLDKLQLSDWLFAKTCDDTITIVLPAENKIMNTFFCILFGHKSFILAVYSRLFAGWFCNWPYVAVGSHKDNYVAVRSQIHVQVYNYAKIYGLLLYLSCLGAKTIISFFQRCVLDNSGISTQWCVWSTYSADSRDCSHVVTV